MTALQSTTRNRPEIEGLPFPCLQLRRGEIDPRVITCGDPVRAEKIAGLLDDAICLQKNREYWTYSGTYLGVPVTVSSHGVGAGGATILFESLARAGAEVIIRVGTCGWLQDDGFEGQLMISTGACRDEGVTEKILPLSYPAIADRHVVQALEDAAISLGQKPKIGITMTNALFYAGLIPSNAEVFRRAGVTSFENEVAALLVVGGIHGIQVGAILAADGPAFELVGPENFDPDPETVKKAVEMECRIALEAIVRL